jgi:hypothetical protein
MGALEMSDTTFTFPILTNSGSRLLADNTVFTELVKKFPAFMKPEGLLPWSQESAIGPYLEYDASNPHLHTLLPWDPF